MLDLALFKSKNLCIIMEKLKPTGTNEKRMRAEGSCFSCILCYIHFSDGEGRFFSPKSESFSC